MGLKSKEDVIDKFGKPDEITTGGIKYPSSKDNPEVYKEYEDWIYNNLSSTVEVRIQIYSDGKISNQYLGKPINIKS